MLKHVTGVAFGFAVSAFAPDVRAHDHWISHGGYQDPISRDACCGERDCSIVPREQVSERPDGYHLPGGSIIPYTRAIKSEDGEFWVCTWGMKVRCLFTPIPGS